ncbi:malto-oligosyltrehalose trehalohydrolase, partial [Streptomyces sp. NPDC059558]
MQFEVWAPLTGHVAMRLDGATYDMTRDPDRDGWWTAEAPAADGSRYGFLLDGEGPWPDPRGRRLPDGPDGLSAVVDVEALAPRPAPAPGTGLQDAVLYELHVGTFTPEGTFDAAAAPRGALTPRGVTHWELVPGCAMAGRPGRGY